MTQTTVHHPTQFNPADYEVLDYLDNKRPVFLAPFDGMSMAHAVEQYKADLARWEADFVRLYGRDWQQKTHQCVHCGNAHVRWITAVRHTPTGEVCTFGADCTKRLGFADKLAFKLAMLKRRADAMAASLKVHKEVEAFTAAHPEVATARTAMADPVHKDNTFVRDILTKLAKYGSLSDKQVAALLPSLARDTARATATAARATEVKVPAPVGKDITITGTVVSVKEHDGQFGTTLKMTVKVETPAGIWLAWGTVPSALLGDDAGLRGKTVTLVATTVAGNDPSFVFFKRPRKAAIIATAASAAVV